MKDKNGFEINSLPPEFTQIAMDSQYDYYKLLLTLPKQEEMQIHIAKL